MGNYAGVDWASEKHDVLIEDETGEELFAGSFAHDEAGLRSLCRTLVRMKVELVAIERPDGLLVERLLDAGLRLLALHPNQVAAARPRFRVSGGKSDRFDAFVLCELARTDHHRFRVLEPDSDQTKALRAMTRAREDLVQTRTALSNQLRAELERFWPGPIGLFTDLDSPISLAFLKRYPSPRNAKSLGEKRMQGFLASQHYTGGKQPAELLAKLRRAPEGRAGELECEARRAVVLSMVAALEPIVGIDQAARAPERHCRTRSPRRRDLPLAVQAPRQRDHCGDHARRDRRLPRPLPNPRRARRRRRPGRRRTRVRQAQGRVLPLGVQQAPTRRVLHAGRQHPPLAPVGRRPLRSRDRARTRPPARHPHPRPRLVPHPVALLARPHPRMTRHATAPCNSTAWSRSLDRRAPAPDLAATQRMLGAAVTRTAARRAERKRLTASRHPLSPRGLMS